MYGSSHSYQLDLLKIFEVDLGEELPEFDFPHAADFDQIGLRFFKVLRIVVALKIVRIVVIIFGVHLLI